jgi:hypothetical protein
MLLAVTDDTSINLFLNTPFENAKLTMQNSKENMQYRHILRGLLQQKFPGCW